MVLGRRWPSVAAAFIAVACGDAPSPGSDDIDLLPNKGLYEREHDGSGYRRIAEAFRARGFDMHVDLRRFDPAWPLRGEKTVVLNRLGTPILLDTVGYYHTALDVMRASPTDSPDVLAPHDGLALAFDWAGNRAIPASPYAGVVAIYDPITHVVTQVMHVQAAQEVASATRPIVVRRGQRVGRLVSPPIESKEAERLTHTHVDFIDGENMTMLNPATLFRGYRDTVPPTGRAVYVADESMHVGKEFRPGRVDVIAELFDRDDDSERNLEVSAIAYEIRDQIGRLLAEQPRCELDDLYASIAKPRSFRALQLVDFGGAAAQREGGWPTSDIDNPDRTFRYALTQLRVKEGRCFALDDANGFLQVGEKVTELRVSVTFWDAKGNQGSLRADIARRSTR